MTSTTGITSVAPSVTATQSVVAPQGVPGLTATEVKTVERATQPQSISPRLIDDPSAGIITQYLDSNGKVQAQYPSTTVVAYLRAGLTAEGLSRHPAENSIHNDNITFA